MEKKLHISILFFDFEFNGVNLATTGYLEASLKGIWQTGNRSMRVPDLGSRFENF